MMLRATLLLVLTLTLSACGFHLRGKAGYELPFQTLYLQASSAQSILAAQLKRSLEANDIVFTPTAATAPFTLQIVSEHMDKQILSLSGAGRVLEYRLQYRVSFRAYDAQQRDWMAPGEITLRRDFSYDDAQVLAKAKEESLLYQDMRNDAVQQILRRLSHVKEPRS